MKINNLYVINILLMFSQGIFGMESLDTIFAAIEVDNIERVKQLAEAGADVNAKNREGFSALNTATKKGNLEIVKYLISKGANVNAKNLQGWTILHFTSAFGKLDIVQYLINNGADIHAKNGPSYGNKTALELAVRNKKMAELLQNYSKLEQEAKTKPTSELLKRAIQEGQYSIFKIILESKKVPPTKEDIELAKAQQLKTKDPLYDKIIRILTSYFAPADSSSQEKKKEECCICYDEINQTEVILACGHGKNCHFECLEQWKNTGAHATCPLCRAVLQ
jgi:Ankyrin repeats (3 copies)/Ring finger domain